MPGVFISHSSKDKPFVTRLAMDLVNEGIPIWFDNWALEPGDSLINEIYSGIDDSSIVLLVLTTASIESRWVEKELRAALAREDQINKKFLIPVKVDDCKIPLGIADRFYADLSGAYLERFGQLAELLKQKIDLDKVTVPPERQIVPVTFTKGLYLRELPFEKRVESILASAPQEFRFHEKQLVIASDEAYVKLRERLMRRMEGIANDPWYTPEFESSFSGFYHAFLTREAALPVGLTMILNEQRLRSRFGAWGVSKACHWFARLIRSELYYFLWHCQLPGAPEIVEKDSGWFHIPLSQAAAFYGVEDTAPFNMTATDNRYLHLEMDAKWQMFSDWVKFGQCPLKLSNYLDSEVVYKYIVPQMVHRHLLGRNEPLLWDFEEYDVNHA